MSRLDDIARQLDDLLGAAKTYWSKARKADVDREEFIALEAEILGRLHMINHLVVAIGERAGPIAQTSLDDQLTKLRQVITGGDFRSEQREPDPARLQAAFAAVGDFVSAGRSVGLRFLRGEWSERARKVAARVPVPTKLRTFSVRVMGWFRSDAG